MLREWKNNSAKEVCSGERTCRSERSCCWLCSSRSLGGKVAAWSCCGGVATARSSKVHCCVGRAVTSEEGNFYCVLLGRNKGEFGCLPLVELLVRSKGRLLAC